MTIPSSRSLILWISVFSITSPSGDFRRLRKTSEFFGNLRKWSCRFQKFQHSQDKNLTPTSQKKLAGIVFPCIFLNSWETKTLKLAKMAFIGQETVRKQQRHNFLWRMYTLIAVFVHFNRFIDLKINFHTNPYNLASSMLLWFWAPCGIKRFIRLHIAITETIK